MTNVLPQDFAIWASDYYGNRIMQFTEVANVKVEKLLQGNETLSFDIRIDDAKVNYLHEDCNVRLEPDTFDRWIVDHFEDGHPGYRTVVCNPDWVKLGWIAKPGSFELLSKTPLQGLTQILSGQSWSPGTTPVGFDLYSLQVTDGTVLSILRDWATVTGLELVFDAVLREINMVLKQGTDFGLGFIYSLNLQQINRKYQGPQVTRLHAFGANNLNVSASNPTTLPYVEDYTWYTDKGLTLAEAKERFTKDLIWVDTRYVLALNLYDAAVAKLATLSQPVISYTAKVVDVSKLLSTTHEVTYEIGDQVRVQDSVLGIDLATRIVRLERFPLDPKLDEIELGFLLSGTANSLTESSSRSDGGGSSLAPIVYENPSAIVVGVGEVNYGSINITSTGATTLVAGSTFVGTASSSGTITFRMVIDGVQVGASRDIAFTNGQQIEFSWPTFAAGLAEGGHDIHWRAIVVGIGTVTLAAYAGRSWILATGALGAGISSSPNFTLTEILLPFATTFTTPEAWTVTLGPP